MEETRLLAVMREAQIKLESQQTRAAERRERRLRLALEDYERVVKEAENEYLDEMQRIYDLTREFVLMNATETSS